MVVSLSFHQKKPILLKVQRTVEVPQIEYIVAWTHMEGTLLSLPCGMTTKPHQTTEGNPAVMSILNAGKT